MKDRLSVFMLQITIDGKKTSSRDTVADSSDQVYKTFSLSFIILVIIDIESLKNRLLEVCYVAATSACLPRLLFI
jgi:hypothetical protein